jgi:hypothetical protein
MCQPIAQCRNRKGLRLNNSSTQTASLNDPYSVDGLNTCEFPFSWFFFLTGADNQDPQPQVSLFLNWKWQPALLFLFILFVAIHRLFLFSKCLLSAPVMPYLLTQPAFLFVSRLSLPLQFETPSMDHLSLILFWMILKWVKIVFNHKFKLQSLKRSHFKYWSLSGEM